MFKSYSLLFAKKEVTYGTDPVPTKAANAILTGPVTIEQVFKKMERLNVKQTLGNRPALSLGEAVKISFETEVRGSGADPAVTPPEIGVLFQGCGMTETITPTTGPVVYSPNDDIEGASITLYAYQHDHLYKVTGCRGTWSLEAKAGEFAKIKWDFTGLYAGPIDGTMPIDSTFGSTLPPAVKGANFSLGTLDGPIENFKLDYGNEIVKRPDVNAATGFLAQFIKDRKATATIDPEAAALSVFDPIALVTAGTEQALSFTVGTVAGNRMTVASAKAVLDSAKYADRENILTWDGSLLLCPSSAGEDDVTVTFD